MTIPLQPPAHHPDLAAALAAYGAAPDAAKSTVYRNEVFPFAAARMLAARDDQPACALLVVPVGTQPYAPLLAALATPAQRVALLVTATSRPCAEDAAAALAQLPDDLRPQVECFSIGEANSGIDVCKAVDAALFWAGDPWPTDVTLDVTGGRKATSAALGAIAGLRGFRQVYIESRQQDKVLFLDERVMALDDVRAWLQEDTRLTASTLLEAGAFAAAVEHFDELAERVLAGPAMQWLHDFAAAAATPAAAERQARFAQLAADLPEGPLREAVAPLATTGAATEADAQRFVRRLQEQGAWR
jgi:hypothetical protein